MIIPLEEFRASCASRATPPAPPEGRENGPLHFPASRGLDDFGGVFEVAESDCTPQFAPQYERECVASMGRGESVFSRLIRRYTGDVTPEDRWRKDCDASDQILSQTHRTAVRLERIGVRAFDTSQVSMCLLDPLTGAVLDAPQTRRVNFLPWHAQARRSHLLKLTEKYMSDRREVPYSRFITVTNGARIPLEPGPAGEAFLRSQLQDLHRKLGRFNDQYFAQSTGLRLILRSTEFGAMVRTGPDGNPMRDEHGEVVPWRDESGRLLVHPHAHCVLVWTQGFVPNWNGLIAKDGAISKYFGAHWDAGAPINDLREALKYPLKPCDLDVLTDDELGALFRATFRLRFVEPLAGLREFIAAADEAKLKALRDRKAPGKPLYMVKDWNRHPLKAPEGRAEEMRQFKTRSDHEGQSLRDLLEPGVLCAAFGAALLISANGLHLANQPGAAAAAVALAGRESGTADGDILRRYRDRAEKRTVSNMIVARIAPGPWFDQLHRPALLVAGYNGRFAEFSRVPLVRDIAEKTRAALEAAAPAGPAGSLFHQGSHNSLYPQRRPWTPPGGWRGTAKPDPSGGAVQGCGEAAGLLFGTQSDIFTP